MFEKRIVIGGLARSGTTLLRCILDASPRVIAGPETAFFRHPLPVQQRRADRVAARVDRALEIGQAVIAGIIRRGRRSVECFDEMMLAYQRRIGVAKDCWAEKTPRNCHSYGWLHEEDRRAYFISLIRDGRDVVTSVLNNRDGYHVSVARYVETMEAIHSFRCEQHLVVRYEDIVRRPEPTVRTVFEFLDLEFDPGVLDRYRTPSATRDPAKMNQPNVSREISDRGVGRWRDAEHGQRVREFLADRGARAWLQRTGYE